MHPPSIIYSLGLMPLEQMCHLPNSLLKYQEVFAVADPEDLNKKSKPVAPLTDAAKPASSKEVSRDLLREQGVHVREDGVDVTNAGWDESLSKVWISETTGELCVSMDRLLFETPLSAAIRYMEPQGFDLNLENILACLDSMKFGVFAKISSGKASDGRDVAKKIIPALYMRLPQRTAKGILLQKFYDEIAKYESELTRLQQYEAQSKRVMQEAVKDETGRAAVLQLQRDNELLRQEVEKLSKRVAQLNTAIQSVPLQHRETQLPPGLKLCQVRQVKEEENTVHLKSEAGQYSCALSKFNGVPVVGARAITVHEGGQVRGVWVFDPTPESFTHRTAEVLYVDGPRIKVRCTDRMEMILEATPEKSNARRGQKIIMRMARGIVVDWVPIYESSAEERIGQLYDAQTKRQISAGYKKGHSAERHVVETRVDAKPQKRRRVS